MNTDMAGSVSMSGFHRPRISAWAISIELQRSTRRHSVGLLTVRLLVLTPAEVNHFSQMAPRAAVNKLASSLRGRIASR